jgi:hypothetical protein
MEKNFSQRQDVQYICPASFTVYSHTALTAVPSVTISFSYGLDRMQELYLN